MFRAFHTIKGSSGMCGLTAVADFTHHIETLLDKVRSGAIEASPRLAEAVLAGRDQVQAIIAAEQGGSPVPPGSNEKLIELFRTFSGDTAEIPATESAQPGDPEPIENAAGEKAWEIRFRPHPALFNYGGNPLLLMRDLSALGGCDVVAHTDAIPPLEEIDPTKCYLWWTAMLHTHEDEGTIRDVFMFAEDGSEVEIKPRKGAVAKKQESSASVAAVLPAAGSAPQPVQQSSEPPNTRALIKESTVRVPAGRLDRLVNLVGELVMNQSRLTQIMTQVGAPELVTQYRRSSDWYRNCATTCWESACCQSARYSAASNGWCTTSPMNWGRTSIWSPRVEKPSSIKASLINSESLWCTCSGTVLTTALKAQRRESRRANRAAASSGCTPRIRVRRWPSQ
jgi:two-component system chemotaxis sensor kinase CheA